MCRPVFARLRSQFAHLAWRALRDSIFPLRSSLESSAAHKQTGPGPAYRQLASPHTYVPSTFLHVAVVTAGSPPLREHTEAMRDMLTRVPGSNTEARRWQ